MKEKVKVPNGYEIEDIVDLDSNMFDEEPADEEEVEVVYEEKAVII